jgi:hypothetical protein
LRYSVSRQIQNLRSASILIDRVLGVQRGESLVDGRPHLVLGRRVVDEWRTDTDLQVCRQFGNVISSPDIVRIGDSGMVSGEFEN